MHNNVSYPASDPNRQERAINDIKEWLGEKRFAILEAEWKKPGMTRWALRVMLSFAGVQGYPVTALADSIGLPDDEPEEA